MFILRELRGDVHLNALSMSAVTPVEAHMLGHDENYTRMFGWSEPFADGADKRGGYAAVEEATQRRMVELFEAALDGAEIAELATLTTGGLASLKAAVPA
jgi:hypothetical protein